MNVVVVTGSRNYTDYRRLADALNNIHREHPITEIRHGAAPGADALASRWAHEAKVNVNAFGAKWGDHGSSAGPRRNVQMLETEPRPSVVVAFPLADSRGTRSCIESAEMRGIRTVIYHPQGRVVHEGAPT